MRSGSASESARLSVPDNIGAPQAFLGFQIIGHEKFAVPVCVHHHDLIVCEFIVRDGNEYMVDIPMSRDRGALHRCAAIGHRAVYLAPSPIDVGGMHSLLCLAFFSIPTDFRNFKRCGKNLLCGVENRSGLC